jgi:hypothetical protein
MFPHTAQAFTASRKLDNTSPKSDNSSEVHDNADNAMRSALRLPTPGNRLK